MFASGLQRRANFAIKGFYASIHSAKGKEVLKERRKEFLAIADPQEFLSAIKKKGSGKNPTPRRNLIHLLRKCTKPSHIGVAARGMQFFQWKGVDFTQNTCAYFISLCANAQKPLLAADMIVSPSNRLGAWLNKKSYTTLLTSLAETNDIETMLKVTNVAISKGLQLQNKENMDLLLSAAAKSDNAEHLATSMQIAQTGLSAEEFAELKEKYSVPASPVSEDDAPTGDSASDASSETMASPAA
eukprot:CAMPEP_0170449330 /NCGR_PEP_ID=MMETSP0117_2-20130122/51190_1 /TAXON_ID=400756 /ORGANISM="Durinskia baltica, Strain CSIRO CS-38" /LENGTH=242 /DNA_ID=CAMNT_0010710571 /DNA_START=21 /DNA_END=749 /DNA_ORIENTATION=+